MFIVKCPHCDEDIIIEEVNCAIFRHGIFKKTYDQIPPHSSKELCDEWKKNDMIYGCGKPFKLVKNMNEINAVICEYI